MLKTTDLQTPCVVIDDTIVEKNLTKAQAYFDNIGVHFRPHVKTHKIPAVAKRQLALGACGINCQKISEAVPFAEAGIDDILITYNILGDNKLSDLYDLAQKCDLQVTADSTVCVDGLSKTFKGAKSPLGVLVECDTGGGRCGVQTPEQACELARYINNADGLIFMGLMTYPNPNTEKQTEHFLQTAKILIEQAGMTVTTITSGGTPTLYNAHQNSVITEHRAGTYIYGDRSLWAFGYTVDDCALTVQATVVSVPNETRCIIDAGAKALTSDLLNQTDYGYIKQLPDAKVMELHEEHGIVDITACPSKPKIGDIINIIPNHCCVVSNLFDAVHYTKNNTVTQTHPIAARGCVF